MTGLTLQQIARALGGEVSGDQVLAPAPGHSPKDRGLSVKLSPSAPDGFVVHLFNGGDVLAARDYVRLKLGLPPFKLRGNGKTAQTTFYDYCDPMSGEVRYRKTRRVYTDGSKDFYFEKPSRNRGQALLYGGERLADLGDGEPVWIVEGEKKVERLREFGAIAVSGDAGACSKLLPDHAELLRALPIILWPDSDEPGEKYIVNAAAAIRAANPTADIRVVRPFGPPDGEKGRDVCDWTGNAEQLAELAAQAQLYATIAAASGTFTRNVKRGGDPAPRIIDPAAPYTTAKTFLDGFVTCGTRTLHHHRGGFYQWNGSAYPEIGETELRSQIYPFLDQSTRRGRTRALQPVKPNQAMVTNILDGLRAASHLDTKIAAPAWIGHPSDLPAAEIVACANGLLHLPTLKLLPNTPEFFTYNALDFAFDPEAPEPKKWLAFLRQLWPEDHEAIGTMQEIFGYCLTCDTSQQKAFLLIGPKRSGKGTIARVLARLAGADNSVAPTLAALGMNFGLAPLIGKRVAIISDARLGGSVDQHAIAERLLSITGEDAVTVDRKYASAWTGQLQTRFVIISNMLPQLADASGALASRFVVLLLTNSFFGREDHTLTTKLLTELPGILNWAIAGWHRLTNFGHFQQPKSALDAVQQFEDLGSPIAAFLRECCEIGAGHSAGVNHMFDAWATWCKKQGRDYPGTVQRFGRDLSAACPGLKTTQHRDDENRYRTYEGIHIIDTFREG